MEPESAEEKILEALTGQHTGPSFYGFDSVEGKLIENPHEQRVIAHMSKWLQEGYNYTQIAEKLDSMLERPKRGTKWRGQVVKTILDRQALLECFEEVKNQ